MHQPSHRAAYPASPASWTQRIAHWPEPLLFGLLLALWVLATSWLRPLSLPDEGRYVGVAWEMVRSGDWLTPTLNGLPYFHKPPLFYWITAASLSLFGNVEWAARLAALLGASLSAGAAWLLIRRWMSDRLSRWYLPVLATTPLFYGGAQFANHDMLVAGFISLSIALTADAVLSMESGRRWRWQLAGGWVAAALGLLSKGLIGIVLPGGVIFFWLILSGRWRALFRLLWWPGPVLFLLVGAPWFVLMQRQFPDFFHYFFVYQHFQRFAQGGFNNAQPLWFYPALLVVATLPWAPWLLARLRLDRSNADSASHGAHKGVRLLMWVWLAVILVFFSIPSSKLVGYALPMIPPLMALVTEGFVNGTRLSERWRVVLLIVAGIACVASVVAVTRADTISTKPLADAYRMNAQANEPLVFLRTYRFDVPFYAGLRDPLVVVNRWDEPILRDSWPKELADAATFRPAVGDQVLQNTRDLGALLCARPVTWMIAPADVVAQAAMLQSLAPVARNKLYLLLRIESSRLQPACP